MAGNTNVEGTKLNRRNAKGTPRRKKLELEEESNRVTQQRRNQTGEQTEARYQTSQGRIRKSTSRKKPINQMKAAQLNTI